MLDVVSSWEAFEVINKGHVTLEITSRLRGGNWELVATASFGDILDSEQEVQPSVSESAICSAMSWKSLDTVVFRLLYALDAQIACKEFQDAKKER